MAVPTSPQQPPVQSLPAAGLSQGRGLTGDTVWRICTWLVCLLPLWVLATHWETGYTVDWANHTWFIGYFGEYVRRHWSLPVVLNSHVLAGLPHPMYYGFLLYPFACLPSILFGPDIAIRIVCAAAFLFQGWQVSKTARAITQNSFLTFGFTAIVVCGTYTLTDMYNRAAITEFVAICMLVSTACLWLRWITGTGDPEPAWISGLKVAVAFALSAGAHPITALVGSGVLLIIGLSTLAIARDPKETLKSLLPGFIVFVIAMAPWVYVVSKYPPPISVATNHYVMYNDSLDALWTRFWPLPRDIRAETNPLKAVSSPYLDAQVNVALLLLTLYLGAEAAFRLRRRRTAAVLLIAPVVTFSAFVFVAYASLSAKLLPSHRGAMTVIQFAYRLCAHCDLLLFVTALVLLYALRPVLANMRRSLVVCLALCAALNVTGVFIKFKHAAAIEPFSLWPVDGGGFHADRDRLRQLPATFYSHFDYYNTKGAGRRPPGGPVYSIEFPIAGGPDFGRIGSVALDVPSPGILKTDLQIFPWNQLVVDGKPIPFRDSFSVDGILLGTGITAGHHEIGYRLIPEPLWTGLRSLSIASVSGCLLLFALVAISGVPARAAQEYTRFRLQPFMAGVPPPSRLFASVRTRIWLLGIAAVTMLAYAGMLAWSGFAPDFAYFYELAGRLSFSDVIKAYGSFQSPYRPTSHYLLYWIGQLVLGWHAVRAWRLFQVAVLIACCFMIYRLALLLFPRRRFAAALGALYYAMCPAVSIAAFEVAPFDFADVFCTIGCVWSFLSAWNARGRRVILLGALSALCYLAAITSNERAVVAPLYLCVVAAVLSAGDRTPAAKRAALSRSFPLCAPMLLIMAVYGALRITAALGPSTTPDTVQQAAGGASLLGNAIQYPLSFAHIFAATSDRFVAGSWNNAIDNLLGIAALIALVFGCRYLWSSTWFTPRLVLLVSWIAIFLIVPLGSSGALTNGNLALVGYAILVGIAVAELLERTAPQSQARAAISLVCACALLGFFNIHEALAKSPQATGYHIAETAMQAPPVAPEFLGQNPFVYVEDHPRLLGAGAYGQYGRLFNLVYLNPDLRERIVPPLDEVPDAQVYEWMAQSNPYFFRFDEGFHWRDASPEFRRMAAARVATVMTRVFQQKHGSDVPYLIGPMLVSFSKDPVVLAQYAAGLETQGNALEAAKYYALSNEALQDTATLYRRAHFFLDAGFPHHACEDFKTASAKAPGQPDEELQAACAGR